MEKNVLTKLNRQVSRQFPEMKGVQPSIRRRSNASTNYTLTYKGKAELPTGKTIKRIVRVTADDQGNILRISTSK